MERFRSITVSSYRNAHTILLVYDVTDQNSFLDASKWISQISTHAVIGVRKVLIANKIDQAEKRVVTTEDG